MEKDALEALAQSVTDRALGWLRDLVAVASVSARGELLQEGADATAAVMRECGLDVELWAGARAPVVFGEIAAPPGSPTLLVYGHYDVQPAEPLDAWTSPPFEATERDGAIYGRGVGDNKGQFLAHLAALRALRQRDELRIGVKVLIEGQEEIGSPGLDQVVARHADRLAADLAITSDAPYHDDGRALVIFGVRGLLYLQIEVRGARSDVHSGNRGGLAPTPAWELVHALASLRDPAGRVLVDGFYDDVRRPAPEDLRMLAALPGDEDAIRAELGVDRLPAAAEGRPLEALMFDPTLNLSGLFAGYDGPGAKTIVPCRAGCKIDVRLVADQDPETVFQSISEHLLARCPGATIDLLASVPPSATSTDTPWATPVVAALEVATGEPPLRRPRLGGTTPDYVFTRELGIPSLLVPYGAPDMNHHAPDEKMPIATLVRGIRCSAAIYQALAAMPSG